MSTIITTTVKTEPATDTLTIGATGDSVAISGDSLNLNTLQDAGGLNKWNSPEVLVSLAVGSDGPSAREGPKF